MKQFAYSLTYIALIGFWITIFTNLRHNPAVGYTAFYLSCFCLLTGCIIFLCAAPRFNKLSKTPGIFRINVISNTLAIEGSLFMAIGLLFQTIHFGGSILLILLGLAMNVSFFILLPFRIIMRRKAI